MIQKQIQGRQTKKKKKTSLLKGDFSFSPVFKRETSVLVTVLVTDEASEFHRFDTRVLFAAAQLCSHAMLSSAGTQSPRFGLFKMRALTRASTQTKTEHES